MSSFARRIRRMRMDDARHKIIGADPRRQGGEDTLQAQRATIGEFVRQIYDAGYDPLTMIEMFLMGAAFFGDQAGVSRQQMADALIAFALPENRQLIFKPST